MKLENKERKLLLALIKEQIRKGEDEKEPVHKWDGTSYKKPKRKYGLNKMNTLYNLEKKLST